jgi:hypothetical protein
MSKIKDETKQIGIINQVQTYTQGEIMNIYVDNGTILLQSDGLYTEAQDKSNILTDIIDSIRSGTNQYWGLGHFHISNMSDYDMMSSTVDDLVSIYDINELQAADIISALTHGDATENEDNFEDDIVGEEIPTETMLDLPPSEPGWS